MKLLFLALTSFVFTSSCATLNAPQRNRAIVNSTMKGHRIGFYHCYEQQYPEGRDRTEASLIVWFIIELDGTVAKTSLKTSTLNNPMVEQCIMTEITTLHFNIKIDDLPMEVTYPFKFHRAEK